MCDAACGASDSHGTVVVALSDSLSTNAVNRGLSDLHTPTWLALVSTNVILRTVLFHPLNVAIARKRVTHEDRPPSVSALMSQAYRGEVGPKGVPSRGGVRGIYRGFGAATVGNLIGEVVYLLTMESVKEELEGGSPALGKDLGKGHEFNANSHAAAVGGMAGDAAALLLITPFAVVCNRQMTAGYGMTASNVYRSAWATAREVCGFYQQPGGSFTRRVWGGLRGLYAGLSPGIVLLPASGMWWALYSETKSVLYRLTDPILSRWELERRKSDSQQKQQPLWKQNWLLSPTDNPVLNAMAGTVASAATTVVFNPIDVLHTRLQALPPGIFSTTKSVPFARVRHIVNDLIHTEGWRGFFKGTTANTCVAVMNGVVFSLLFELTKLGSDRDFLRQL
ncbi:mitochondrial carrier protein [Trypanosoma grayi]|uniref:mitochondrial carrier protein n=1 Tax=Trypanosoma grayi TaxID=71804 RepID=UPI0004F414C2|nr:mitochondrial carrier protein [Trypanosoma grayi]KEG13299.1 mitochondrial carrier protein [Trypanosoma grayi]